MSFPIFLRGLTGVQVGPDGRAGSPRAERIRALSREALDDPSKYVVPEDVAHAINVALLLGMPLLVTGEPGTGKTELGRVIAHELQADEPLFFETKSTSQAKDLFYSFDVVGRFGAREVDGASHDPRDYIVYNALGRAIIEAFPFSNVSHLLPPSAADQHRGPRRSVVVIDEIDKAPRDFPNDVLNEMERMAFRVPELQNAATPGLNGQPGVTQQMRPIVIITSNSERGLPDAFLRRCIYVDISFPDAAMLEQIVSARLEGLDGASSLVTDALALFSEFRNPSNFAVLVKRPSTSELLNWLQVLRALGFEPVDTLRTPSALARLERSLVALVKNRDDLDSARRFVSTTWCKVP